MLAALAVGVAAVLTLATVLLPGWLEGRGAQWASEALGRQVRVQTVQVQPWRFAIVMEGVSIAGTGAGQPPLLQVQRLDAALSLRSLLRGRPVVESLTVRQPALYLARTAVGRYDVDDLVERFTAQPGSAPAADDTAPGFAVHNVELTGGSLLFDDRPVQRRHELRGLRLALPFLSTLSSDVAVKVTPQLSGTLDGVAFDSRAEAAPFASDAGARLTLKFVGLELAPFGAYAPPAMPARLSQGRLDVNLALDFAAHAKQPVSARLTGMVELHDAVFTQPDGRPLLSFKRLQVPLMDVQPLRHQLGFGRIVLESPTAGLPHLVRLPAPPDGPVVAPAMSWQVSTQGVDVLEGTFDADGLVFNGMQFRLAAAAWPLKTPTQLDASLRLDQSTLTARARLTPELLQVDATVSNLQVGRLAAWLPLPVGARLQAGVSTRGVLRVTDPLAAGSTGRVQLALMDLQLRDLRLDLPGAPGVLALAAGRLDQAGVDLAGRSISLGALTLEAPRAELARDVRGRLNLATWAPSGGTNAAATPVNPAPATGAAWSFQWTKLTVERGAMRWRDAATPADVAPVALAVEPLRLQVGALRWPAAAPVPVQMSAQLAPLEVDGRPAQAGAGGLQWTGQLGLAPLAAAGRLQAQALPLQWLNAYLDPTWGLQLQRAELGMRADFDARLASPGAWAASVRGDMRLGPLALLQARMADGRRVVGEDLLSWQQLQLDGIQLAMSSEAPPRVAVREAQLDDAYARLIINEQGRLNLRDIGPAEAAANAAAVSAPRLEFAVERVRVNRGLLDFSDRFVRPNYSARLSELQGSLGAFSSAGAAMAPLTLRGRIAGTGRLEIDGQIKPGAPLAMDVAANATDIELAPLSPYAAKYAGYAIEQGKLSTQLRYQVAPGGQLVASNQIILNQLTFGERVESADATTLPVRFAVALLKDRDGVIDVNLPVSGSLNDPEFSVGGVVWKLVLNLIGKALTSPFALFSGQESSEEAQVSFHAGRTELAAVDPLDRIARLLADKPGVRLTLTGWASQEVDAQSLCEQKLAESLKAEHTATPETALKRLYVASPLPSKPRNAFGLLKDLPPAQMRGFLLGGCAVDEEALRQLATARATAVRDALLARGAPNVRLFLASPKLCGPACDAAWRPHVELTLGAH